MTNYLLERGPYLLVVVLTMVGVYRMVADRNFLSALVGLFLVQSGIIFFFVSLAVLRDGTVPILSGKGVLPMANPLPHALMLTAIVVGVATFGVGVAILCRLQDETRSVDDAEPGSADR